MSITFPRTDILSPFYFAVQSLRLSSMQEIATQASGAVRGKDLGSAIWFADYSTVKINNDDALTFEAKLNSLDGVVNPFEAGDVRRPYPYSHQDGIFNDTGTLNSVNANNKAIRIANLPAGFVITPGDYFHFSYSTPLGTSRALHQVVEGTIANGSGLTSEFEVRPHLRQGWAVGAAIVFKQPKGLFTLLPNSVNSQTQGPFDSVVSFKAVQYI